MFHYFLVGVIKSEIGKPFKRSQCEKEALKIQLPAPIRNIFVGNTNILRI